MQSRYFKRFFCTFLLIFSFNNNHVYGAEKEEKNELSLIEKKLVKNAIKNINKQLSNKTGNPERVTCCYKLFGSDPISASIKTFYIDYRKEADYKKYDFKKASELASYTPDQIIEIIYKSHEKNQLTIVCKKNKRRSCKYVNIS